MRRLRRSLVAGSVAALLAALIGPAQPAVSAGPTDGLLAAHTAFYAADGARTYFPSELWGAQEFSPDGTMMAGVVTQTALTVWGSDGSVRTVATLPSAPIAITWSPDQTQLGVLVEGDSGDLDDASIVRVPVSGGVPQTLVGQSSTLHLSQFSEQIAWSPDGSRLAFVASVPDEFGSYRAHDFDQLYTVPATGGSPTRYTERLPDCEFPSCTTVEYEDPVWAADGSALFALVTYDFENYESGYRLNRQYVGRTSGAAVATPVRELSRYENTSSYSHLGSGPLVLSASGDRLLLGVRAVQHGVTTPTVISASTGATLSTYATSAVYTDWQPCPSGTCATWPPPAKLPTTLKGRIGATSWSARYPPSLIGTLSISPTRALTGPISLVIDGKVARSATLTTAMANRFSFVVPVLTKGTHTIQLRYGGNTVAKPSTTGVVTVRVT